MELADLMVKTSYIKQRKLGKLAAEILKKNMEIKRAKTRLKIIEREERKFRGI